jgi:spermidine/putrescine transport system substrate-binding protein
MTDDKISILMPRQLSRRKMMKIMGAAAAMAGLGPAAARAAIEPLNMFTWTAFGDDNFVKFSQERGLPIRPTFYSTSDEMVAKLKGGGAGLYDMVAPIQSYVPLMAELGLIAPMDKSRITNLSGVFPEFIGTPEWEPGGVYYGTPLVWGANAIAYNRKVTGEIDSIEALFDQRFAGQISMRDEPEDSLAVGALKLGIKQPYEMDEAALQEVKKLMISQKPLVRSYWHSFAELQTVLGSGEAALAWSFLAVVKPLREQGIDCGWVWPKEGALGWNEGIALVATSKRKADVEDYANLTLAPEYGKYLGQVSRYATTSAEAVKEMDPRLVEDLGINPESMSQLVFKKALPNRARWIEIWNEVKAA